MFKKKLTNKFEELDCNLKKFPMKSLLAVELNILNPGAIFRQALRKSLIAKRKKWQSILVFSTVQVFFVKLFLSSTF